MNDVGIMVVAQNIDESIKNRFKDCIGLSKPKASYDIHFLTLDNPDKNFNKSKTLNAGIKKLSKCGYKVIIQTDIDLIIPPGLIDKSLEVGSQPKICFYNHHRRIDPNNLPKLPNNYKDMNWSYIFQMFPFENANGCWNAMTPESWMASGGYNEYMIEWGREDDIFRTSSTEFGGIRYVADNSFCLIHVNHPPRTKDMRKHNTAMAVKAKSEGIKNWLI